MHSLRRLSLGLTVLICTTVLAQTGGSISGTVHDSNGGALPGVTVQAKSSAAQGVRTAISDESGIYRLPLLPPGAYTLTFSLSGFANLARPNVPVALGRDTTIDATMKIAQSEEVTVSAAAPVLDTGSNTTGETLGQRAIASLPTGRNYSSIAQVTPGVSSDANPSASNVTGVYGSTISVYGSSGAENAFFIDGVNTTNAEYGFQGKELNFEFIQEVDVKTGGYEAEYGRSTGGIINVITKSGGNEFRGDVFGYYDNDSLQNNAKRVVSTGGTQTGFTRKDYGVDVGGYVLRDRLWFFGAYDGVRNSIDNSLPEGPRDPRDAARDRGRPLQLSSHRSRRGPRMAIVARRPALRSLDS